MTDLADQTGGEAFVGTNDYADALRHSMMDGANYYTLAYQPQNQKWNGQFRKIRVELAGKKDSLTYRRGYFAYPDNASEEDPSELLNVALQPDTPESTMLALHSTIDLPDAQHGAVLVHTIVGMINLNLVLGTDGHRRGQIVVRLVAFNDTPGKPEDQPDAPPQTSAVLNLDFDPSQYQLILNNGIAFTQQIKLPPGRYRLRLGVSDMASHRLGTLDMPIAVPAVSAKN